MFPTLLSLAQIERVQEATTTAQENGRTVAGVELVQPFMTSAITVTVVFDNGEDAEPRYEIDTDNSRTFLVCGKDVTELVAAAQAEREQTDENVEVQA
jgi:hypothetical protein